MKPVLDKLVRETVYNEDAIPLVLTWTIMIIIPEFIAQISIIVTLNKRYKIWFDRLNIFSLGAPDGAIVPDEEILA